MTAMPQTRPKFGVIYLAFGNVYLAMALTSFASLKKTNPDIPATIVTNALDVPPDLSYWTSRDSWIHVNSASNENRAHKTSIHDYSPYVKSLYLDCDTIVTGDLSLMSFYLDYFDLAARGGKWPGPPLDRKKVLFDGRIVFSDLPYWNGGVIGFRDNARVGDFFRSWNRLYSQLGFKRDQPSLAESAIRSDCRILSLEPRWNFGDSLTTDGLLAPKAYREKVVIWHYKTDIDGPLQQRIREIAQASMPDGTEEVEAYLRNRNKLPSKGIARRALRAIRGRLA
jgi:hypothetical protein